MRNGKGTGPEPHTGSLPDRYQPPGSGTDMQPAQHGRIPLVPGQDFDPRKVGLLDREAIKIVPKLALLEMGGEAGPTTLN